MKDASRAYSHYRDGTGESMWINYERAYQEDSMIHDQLDKEAETIKSAAIYFYNQGAGTSFGIIGDKIAVPNGENENWQKTIGAHYAYAYSRVKVNETSKQMTITITYTMEDMYNFNKGMSDIASGTPDDVNGRFSVLGWAKEFKTYGSFSRSITFNY